MLTILGVNSINNHLSLHMCSYIVNSIPSYNSITWSHPGRHQSSQQLAFTQCWPSHNVLQDLVHTLLTTNWQGLISLVESKVDIYPTERNHCGGVPRCTEVSGQQLRSVLNTLHLECTSRKECSELSLSLSTMVTRPKLECSEHMGSQLKYPEETNQSHWCWPGWAVTTYL